MLWQQSVFPSTALGFYDLKHHSKQLLNIWGCSPASPALTLQWIVFTLLKMGPWARSPVKAPSQLRGFTPFLHLGVNQDIQGCCPAWPPKALKHPSSNCRVTVGLILTTNIPEAEGRSLQKYSWGSPTTSPLLGGSGVSLLQKLQLQCKGERFGMG